MAQGDYLKNKTVCVVGLGYVGLPLAEAFSKHIRTVGFDVDVEKVKGINDSNNGILCTSDPSCIKEADFDLICVPTPVTKHKEPDLYYVRSAAEVVGKNLKRGAIVVLESTVYPGVTEEIVVPILEREFGMKCGQGFKVGYSPERVNPGDKEHTIEKITKIVSGMDDESTRLLVDLYGLITQVYVAKNIKIAEAAKVIENIQRDINIALMNELSLIFHKMGLNTQDILEAAGTKWNFHKYTPGLVGGHCIPVDPYYLVYKAREMGYHPQVILAGRMVNDYMPKHVAELAIKGLIEAGKTIKGAKVLIMGLTYKENVPDIRQSPSKDLIKELSDFRVDVYAYDPYLNAELVKEFGAIYYRFNEKIKFDSVIITVAHEDFKKITLNDLKQFANEELVLIDVRDSFVGEKNKINYISL